MENVFNEDKCSLSVPQLLIDTLQSRKLSLGAITRHFVHWKRREFKLDPQKAVLIVLSPEKTVTTIYLKSPTISWGRHNYAPDFNHWLWIKYFDKTEQCPKEVVMKFDDFERMLIWEKVHLLLLVSALTLDYS
jgi:hypothetical protein